MAFLILLGCGVPCVYKAPELDVMEIRRIGVSLFKSEPKHPQSGGFVTDLFTAELLRRSKNRWVIFGWRVLEQEMEKVGDLADRELALSTVAKRLGLDIIITGIVGEYGYFSMGVKKKDIEALAEKEGAEVRYEEEEEMAEAPFVSISIQAIDPKIRTLLFADHYSEREDTFYLDLSTRRTVADLVRQGVARLVDSFLNATGR
jgi:hypothetical protein